MAAETDVPRQYWLDMERPIQPRPPRERRARGERRQAGAADADAQMALTMPEKTAAKSMVAGSARPRLVPVEPAPDAVARPCFVLWLRDQSKRKDAIGELAKAVRIDPAFPRAGSAEDVRSRFDKVGADGDAFAALEDAERAYDRAA